MSIEHGPNPEGKEGEGRFRVAAESVPSAEHPNRNEDAFIASQEHGVFGVFDGTSIPPGGERASAVARATIIKELKDLPAMMSESEAEETLTTALKQAHLAVKEEQSKARGYRVKTAGAVVFIRRDQTGRGFAAIGSAADSRVWTLRNETLEQVTTDNVSTTTPAQKQDVLHALQQRLNEVATPDQLSRLEPLDRIMFHERRQVSNTIGDSQYQPVVFSRPVEPSDVILITSDGIHDNLTTSEITEILKANQDPSAATSALIQAAQERSRDKNHIRAKPDDMTALVVEIADSSP